MFVGCVVPSREIENARKKERGGSKGVLSKVDGFSVFFSFVGFACGFLTGFCQINFKSESKKVQSFVQTHTNNQQQGSPSSMVPSHPSTNNMTSNSFPHPFALPSPEFCETNSAGDDVYSSIFKPCIFTYYREPNSRTQTLPIRTFDCSNFDLEHKSLIVPLEKRKVHGWPDSCVANGPRCYVLAEYPSLRKFTLFGDTECAISFPPDVDIVSVDCSNDYAEALDATKDPPQALQPLTTAVFAFVMFFALVTCTIICFMCLMKSKRSRGSGYHEVPLVYDGPPVVARSIGGARNQTYHSVVV